MLERIEEMIDVSPRTAKEVDLMQETYKFLAEQIEQAQAAGAPGWYCKRLCKEVLHGRLRDVFHVSLGMDLPTSFTPMKFDFKNLARSLRV